MIANEAILGDIVNRASWYFPKSELSNVIIYIPVELSLLHLDINSLRIPKYEEHFIREIDNIRLINNKDLNLNMADIILIWDKKYLLVPEILANLHKVEIVDPDYYFTVEASTYRRLYCETLDAEKKQYMQDLTKKNFKKLIEETSEYNIGYVFGTGPSLDKAMDYDYSKGFRIICNNIIKNKKLMDHIEPHVLTFGDAQHHSGPSKYAASYRNAVLEKFLEYDFYILIEDFQMPLYLAHFPEFKDKILGLSAPGVWDLSIKEILHMIIQRPDRIPWFDKIPGHNEVFNFPESDKFYVRLLGSVLPSFMVPFASSICNNIYIIGADGQDPNGRKPDNTYIWSYSSSCEFDDKLKQSLYLTHPSYFRDRPRMENFDIYCENFEELLQFGESLGKKYFSLAPSFIPSLARRRFKK
jgi:hypothetical protein